MIGPDVNKLGQTAYTAFLADYKTLDGAPTHPPVAWNELSDQIKAVWIDVALAVTVEARRQTEAGCPQ